VTGTQQHFLYRTFLVTKGMADYRAGDFANAIDRINQGLSLGPAPWYWFSRDLVGTAHVFLAMAHKRLGHAEQARQALHQATPLAAPRNSRSGGDWYDWIRLHFAYQEAERLLKDQSL
jgi:Flp pilus assembly protein TadD